MNEIPILPGSGGTEALRGPGEAKRTETASPDAPAFRSLLEQLEQRAQELRRHEAEVGDASRLAGALGDARASLEDALTLKDQLLEAYRASLSRGEPEAQGTGE
ncbi:hypothetical protein [Engelhardtia mirabilis]|uniref:Uncharacterized protein n=1 Tax=Engelhardtia mirabilis TaxID=2528011 RepID=A0A518BSX0_9BACT|nr:hypothetical protein Pla133_51990 [Planctomycetes bacterium Pla133]QDV04401.1 hypothetical protein Pla86_51960 [Planctomycetes bacterium Pla86]